MGAKKTYITATKEEVIDYYITQNHTLKDTANYFKCGEDAVANFCKRNNIFKVEGRKKKTYLTASFEEVYDYYIIQNHSVIESANYFNCGKDAFSYFCKRNNIKKDRKLTNKVESKSKLDKKEIRRDELIKRISKKDLLNIINDKHSSIKNIFKKYNINKKEYNYLKDYYKLNDRKSQTYRKDTLRILNNYDKDFIYDYYITQNHTINECMEFFKVKRDTFLKCLDYYNIDKVVHLSDIIKNIDENEFKYYVKNNHSFNEITTKFNIDYWQLISLLDYFKIEDKDIAIKTGTIPENEFKQLLINNNIEYEYQFNLNNYRYDFKVGNKLIEINPSYTHNSFYGFRNLVPSLDKKYHYTKTKNAVDNGYNCISIWDWDDVNKVLNIIKPRDRVYARKCSIKEVDLKKAKEYLNKYHLQGYARDKIRLGLYNEDELVGIMTFGKPRYNKKYEWELVRLCSHKYVVGGAEKLFNYFVHNYNPNSIISYCDMSKFKGETYLKLGFKYKSYSINKHWYNIKEKIHITDNLLRQRGFDQLFKTNYGKGTSNEELMRENGFVEIYDCGQASYVWEK